MTKSYPPPIIARALGDAEFDATGSNCLELACDYCGSPDFNIRCVKGELHYRVVCAACNTVQIEFTSMFLGRIDGVS